VSSATPDSLGTSLSVSGDYAVAGVPISGDTVVAGSAYVFERNGASWGQAGPVLEPDTNLVGGFGSSVSLSGDTAVIGTPEASTQFGSEGAVYAFVRDAAAWVRQGPALTEPYERSGGGFGNSVSISGDTLMATGHSMDLAGRVFVFTRTGTVWTQQGPELGPTALDNAFGTSVSLSGDIAVIAGNGAAYVFGRSAGVWFQRGSALQRSSAVFASAPAISGQYIVLGEPAVDTAQSGSAYVYSDACLLDADCPTSAYCAGGTCFTRCALTADCPIGSECAAGGACEPVIDTSQGGDAGLAGDTGLAGAAGSQGVSGAPDAAGSAGASEESGAGGYIATGGASGEGGHMSTPGNAGSSTACTSDCGTTATSAASSRACGCRVGKTGSDAKWPLALTLLCLASRVLRRKRRSSDQRH
jgi:FG-GAP repeat